MMLKEDRRAEVVTNQVKVKVQPSLWIDSTLRKKHTLSPEAMGCGKPHESEALHGVIISKLAAPRRGSGRELLPYMQEATLFHRYFYSKDTIGITFMRLYSLYL